MVGAPRLLLAPADIIIVLLFLGAILALGFSVRLRSCTVLQYLAAGRSLTLPLFVATLVSTWYGGILGIGESVSYFGLGTWVLLGAPYYVFALVYAALFAKRVRAAEQISLPERIEIRFGREPALVAAALVFLLGVPAAHVAMLGVLTQLLTGWDPAVSVLTATVIGTLFLYKGGLLADARVSALAFVMMYVGFAVIVGWCLHYYPLSATIARLDPKLLTWDGGAGWITVLGFFILGAWTIVDPGFHQRVASARDSATGVRGVIVSVLCWFVFDALTILTGLYALGLMPKLPEQPLQIFPLFGAQVLPPGLLGIFLCGMLGTILSAMVGYALVSGATLGRDLVCRARGTVDDSAQTKASRIGVAAACGIAILLALSIRSVVALWYQWGGCVIGALLLPVCAAYLRAGSRVSSRAWAASMALGFTVSFAWMAYSYSIGNINLEIALVRNHTGISLLLPKSGASVEEARALASAERISVSTLLVGFVVSTSTIGVATALASIRRRK